ncbi:hypothetical protein M405DRAFT_810101 [Rhizopogon salebrosus TDB-379]|nr:hypothetical protein M405DRAFT_810101 [Rhizopogon salebrosus TDB-379]
MTTGPKTNLRLLVVLQITLDNTRASSQGRKVKGLCNGVPHNSTALSCDKQVPDYRALHHTRIRVTISHGFPRLDNGSDRSHTRAPSVTRAQDTSCMAGCRES